MEHYIVAVSDKHREKIQKHLGKYLNVHEPVWMMTSGSIAPLQFKKFRHKVLRYQIKGLILSNNGQEKMLKDIGGGKFQYLQILNLSNNSIRNLEALLAFQALNLLTNFRSLRKFVNQHLKILDVSYNYLTNISGLQEFNCPNLNNLTLTCNQGVGVLLPLFKSNMNPQMLYLAKMDLVGPTAKDIYIDTCWRRKLRDGLPRTKI